MKSLATLLLGGMFLCLANGTMFGQSVNHVVISEVYGGGGNSGSTYKNDFIELYNPTGVPVNVTGWTLQYASSAGNFGSTSTTQMTTLSGIIPAYGYFLVQEAAGTGGTKNLPTPDVIGVIAISGTSGKVALVNNAVPLAGQNPVGAASIVDFAGCGSAANGFEGSGPTVSMSNSNSVSRKPSVSGFGSNYDTDNNASDFNSGLPTPQNSTIYDPTPYPVTAVGIIAGAHNDLAITWNAPVGNSDGVIVLIRAASAVVTTTPTNAYAAISGANSVYTSAPDAGTNGFGSAGDKLVYRGTGTNVTVTGLANGTYHISILTGSAAAWSVGVLKSEVALPVELTSFTVTPRGSKMELAWATATEVNNAGFAIEKKSAHGEWTKLAFVDGHGTTNAPQSYSYTDVCTAGKYSYRLKQIDRDGMFEYSTEVEAEAALTLGDYALGQNYPNPFNPATSIRFAVKEDQRAKLVVFNMLGQEVAILFDGLALANTMYDVAFTAAGLSSGTYFYMLQTGEKREVKKMSLMK